MTKKAIVKSTGELVTLIMHRKTFKSQSRGELFDILEDNHRHIFEEDLFIIEDEWEFIGKYLPGYSSDERVAQSDDISCCLDAEADDEKLLRVRRLFGETPEEWQRAQIEIDRELLEDSARNYMTLSN